MIPLLTLRRGKGRSSARPPYQPRLAPPCQGGEPSRRLRGVPMGITSPTVDQVRRAAETLGFSLDAADLESYRAFMEPFLAGFRALESLPAALPPVRYARRAGWKPSADENRFNAWNYKAGIKGAAQGALAGKTVALKDNIMLAGIPMMNGATLL